MALICATVAAAVALWGAGQLGDVLYTEGSFNLWFSADNPRVIANLLDASSYQYRATVHPIFPILVTPWASLLPNLGFTPLWWGKAIVCASGAATSAILFLALRLVGVGRAFSALMLGVFVASAAFLHWYSEIEIAPFNGLSISLALLALAYGPTKRWIWWVAVGALTLGFTITNWSAGLAATIARWPLRRAMAISVITLMVVVALSLAQRAIYPTASFFFSPMGLAGERDYSAMRVRGWSPTDNLRSLVIYSAATPPPVLEAEGQRLVVTNQHQSPASAGWLGVLAMSAWIALLACGVVGAVAVKSIRPVAVGVGLMIAAQLALGLIYGDVSFLYAMNLTPMFIMLAAFSGFTRLRYAAAALAMVVIVAGSINNVTQFKAATALAEGVIAKGGNPKWSRFAPGRVILPMPTSSRVQ
jgi:hypothetical protein